MFTHFTITSEIEALILNGHQRLTQMIVRLRQLSEEKTKQVISSSEQTNIRSYKGLL